MLEKIKNFIIKRNVLFILALLIIFFSIRAGDYFLTGLNIHNVARQIAFNVPLALALTIVLIAGGIDLSVGSVLSMAAAITMDLQPHGAYLAVLVALLFGALIGLINGLLVTKGKIVPFIATLGTMTLVQGVMLTYTQQQPIAGTNEAFTFWGGGSIGFFPTPFILVIIISIFISLVLRYTQFGRNLYSVGGNAEAAFLSGIKVDSTKLFSFIISGILAAISGILIASRLNSSTVHIGLDSVNLAIAGAIMGGASMTGGKGDVLGAFMGILTLGILINGMNLMGVNTYYQIGIRALILIIVVVIDAITAIRQKKKLEQQAHGEFLRNQAQ